MNPHLDHTPEYGGGSTTRDLKLSVQAGQVFKGNG
jgi:hypothetical protein